ncbi:MAG: hypothetical protein RLZZ568_81, partial [Cyanobacteriota bacterium]
MTSFNPREEEMNFLESVIHTYVTSESPQDRLIKSLAIRAFKPYIKPAGRALEFGCCDGFMTSLIYEIVDNLVVVDGSTTFIEMTRQRVPNDVEFVHSLFEDYKPNNKFDYIFATYVLEHVANAVDFLLIVRSLLSEQGLLFLVVPNA